ncbi:MAG TPA: DUF3293 domain-containing protein [Methylophilaceae bacterium]|jgi:hypothetical protein
MIKNGKTQSPPLSFAELDMAYRATGYLMHLRGEAIRLRVDQPSPEFSKFLEHTQCDQWAFISAVNPGSELLTEAANAGRHRKLLATVSAQKLVYFPGDAVPNTGKWPIEPGLLLLHISLEQAMALAHEFGQAAILAGHRNGVPKLHYCSDQMISALCP